MTFRERPDFPSGHQKLRERDPELARDVINSVLVARSIDWQWEGYDIRYKDEWALFQETFGDVVKVVTDLLASIEQSGGIASPNVVALSRNLSTAQTLHDDLVAATRSYERQYAEMLKLAEAYREIAAASTFASPERDRAHLAWCRAMTDMTQTGNSLGEAHWRLKWLLEFEYPYDEDGGEDDSDEDGGEQ